jgi:hypothetical protein
VEESFLVVPKEARGPDVMVMLRLPCASRARRRRQRATLRSHTHTLRLPCAQLEVAVGFDHGPRAGGADLTLFALMCRDVGARFAWLDAPTEEPAPLTPSEFLARRRRAMACRLLALAASGDSTPGALSVDRRVALAIMTGARGEPVACVTFSKCVLTLATHRAPRATPVSSTCAQLCMVVTALSVIIQHQVSISELVVSFVISFCTGTVLFCYMLGFASSCSPLSFGGGPVGWVVFCSLLLAQVRAPACLRTPPTHTC